MKTNYDLQLSAAAVGANPRVRPSNKGRHVGLPLRFARWIFLQFCIFAFLPTFAQTLAPDFTDPRDGQTYKTVLMPDGKRWMVENLRYRRGLDNPVFGYRGYNGVTVTSNIAAPGTNLQRTYYCPGPGPFPTSPNTTNSSQADPLRCEYEGCLYPFWTAYGQNQGTANVYSTPGEQGVCPDGWHLPSDGEWTALSTQLNNDYSSLLVLNAGYRVNTGIYSDRTSKAFFWTSSGNGTAAVSRSFSSSAIARNASQPTSDALSVRCIEGECKESSNMLLTVVPNTEGCALETVRYRFDTIEFSETTKDRVFNFTLSPALSTGTWTYSVSYEGLPINGVSFVSNPTISSTRITLSLQGLSAAADNQAFTIKIAGTNPNYCKLDTQFFEFRLLQNVSSSSSLATFTDPRDGKVYPTVVMPDGKTWFAKNLNFTGCTQPGYSCPAIANSTTGYLCYGNIASNCTNEGALYPWATTMLLDGTTGTVNTALYSSGSPATANNQIVDNATGQQRGICPQGWHVPTDKEWGTMLNAVEAQFGGTLTHYSNVGWGGNVAGQKLKACFSSGGTSEDVYGFSVLAAGQYYNNFIQQGTYAFFWSASAHSSPDAWYRKFFWSHTTVSRGRDSKTAYLFSVRCLQD